MPGIKKAIVIGGGPCGLAAALRLKKHHGIDVAVYEIRPEPATAGGAVSIPPNGLRLFDRLGQYEQLAARGNGASQFLLHSMHDEVLIDIDRAVPVRDEVGFGFMRVLRADVMEVLLEAVQAESIPIHYGQHLSHILETEDCVTATFADGMTATADVLLGCDGIHSAVRKLHVCPEAVPEYSGISNMYAILLNSRLAGESGALSALHATLTLEGIFGVTACTASLDQLYWFYSREVAMPSSESDRDGWSAFGAGEVEGFKERTLRVLQGATGEWVERLRDMVSMTEAIRFYPIYKMPATGIWSTARCLLLGDAAHAMQPHVGQGVSMALEDVFCLSKLLEDDNRALDHVFQRYDAVRRPRVEAISRDSAETGEIRMNTSQFRLRMKETMIGMGFWLYKTAGLQRWGVGMDRRKLAYDITEEAS